MERNLTIYNDNMRKSMMDKIFFMDKIDADIFIDFGCADGSMIHLMNSVLPNKKYIGYDNNLLMIDLAKKNNPEINTGFYDNWDLVLKTIKSINKDNNKVCIIFSSILHEVENKPEFFDSIDLSMFDYVVIREMFLDYSKMFTTIQTLGIINKLPKEIQSYYSNEIFKMKNVIQSIFKSYYKENLSLELKEDYFSFDETAMKFIEQKFNLKLLYKEKFLLPYWREKIITDFEIDLSFLTTHIKLIYQK